MNQVLLAALLLVQSPNGTITGRLLSAAGTPAVGVRVTAKPVVDAAAPATPDVLVSISQTDLEGRFRLENIPPGRYYITAGLVGVPTYYPGTMAIGTATALNVTAGSTASVPDFAVQQLSLRPAQATPAAAATAGTPDYWLRLIPKLADPVVQDAGPDARSAYEAIGQIAGLRVLFDRRFVTGAPLRIRVQGITALAALNLVSAQTGNDWTMVGRDTILVVPTVHGVRNLDLQLPTRDLTGAAVYPGFQPKAVGPLSFDIKAQSPAVFETIASASGLTVVIDQDFRTLRTSQLKLENADIYSAFDILSAQVGAFWMPYDSNTIVVSNDNATKHRIYDLRVVKMYYLSNLKTAQETVDAANVLRQKLSLSLSAALPMANAILVVDNPGTIALADKLIAELDKTQGVRAATEVMDAAGNLFVLEPAGLRNVTRYRTELQPRQDLFSIDIRLPTRQAFEKIAELGGVSVVFDSNLGTGVPSQVQLKLNDVDFFKALDVISLKTRTFWFPLDSKTVFVASDLSTTRRDFEPQIVKTFYPNVTTSQEANDIMNVIRLFVNATIAISNSHAKAVIIRDTPVKVALAEMLIAQLGKTGGASAEIETYTVSNTFVRDFSGRHTMTAVRSQLKPDFSGPVSLQLNGNAREAYEALAKAAGIQVTFDSRFVPGGAIAFQIDKADIFEALGILAYQTKTFWRVTDSKTIQVAPATNALRNELESKIQKSVPLMNVRASEDVSAIVNAVRQVLFIQSGIAPNASMTAIDMNETAEKIAVAEALIKALDVP